MPSCLLHGYLLLVLDTFMLAILYLEHYTMGGFYEIFQLAAAPSRVVPHALAHLRDPESQSKKKKNKPN